MSTRRLTWAEQFEEKGWHKGVDKGLELGREQGVRQTLLRLLRLRFGPLSDDVKQQIEAISSVERLNQMAEQLLFVRSLEEMGLQPGNHSKDCPSTSAPAAGESA